MKCLNCGKEFEGKFCPECGTPVGTQIYESGVKVCPNCGNKLLPKAIRCPTCGTDVSNAAVFNRSDNNIFRAISSAPKFNNPSASKSTPTRAPKGCGKSVLILVGVFVLLSVIINSCRGNKSSDAASSSIPSSTILSSTVQSSKDPEKTFEQKFSDDNNIDLSTANNIFKASEAIGIPRKEISSFSKIEDWASGERYQYNYKDAGITIYLNKDKTVNGLTSGTVKLYEKGKALVNINDKIITSDQKVTLQMSTKDVVTKALKAPSTAKFPGGFLAPFEDWSFARDKDEYQVSSYVDAQNSFGAMIRSDFIIKVSMPKDGDAKITYFKLGDEVIIG